jgi:transcriptional regulator with XRE-family HTH domain
MELTAVPQLTLGDRLRISREHAGYRGRQGRTRFAAAMHKDVSQLSRWETNATTPDYPALYLWADLTQCSLEWLVSGALPGSVTDRYLRRATSGHLALVA